MSRLFYLAIGADVGLVLTHSVVKALLDSEGRGTRSVRFLALAMSGLSSAWFFRTSPSASSQPKI